VTVVVIGIITLTSPFTQGIDVTARAVLAARTSSALKFWSWLFRNEDSATGSPRYTVERFVSPSNRIVYTADPHNIKAVLATQFADFGKGPQLYKDFHEFLGDGIFAVDGKPWSQARRLIRPNFIKDRVSDLEIIERHVFKTVQLLKQAQDVTVDVQELFFRFTLDVITEYLFGWTSGCLDNANSFADAFAVIQRTQNTIGRAGCAKESKVSC
jgi:cytochrome P450